MEIQISHLKKRFKDHDVLNDISITFKKGRIYGITGYNGSGKSVFFKCVCGLITPDFGQISIGGKVLKRDMDMITNAGVIIDEPAFLPNYTAYQNLMFLYTINHNEDKGLIHAVLTKVGLDPCSKKKVKHFSLGMKQRLAIAQAIIEDPDIIILDEPMNGLDKKGVTEMRHLFSELKESGKIVLLASHNREDIDILCDEVYEMENGILKKQR